MSLKVSCEEVLVIREVEGPLREGLLRAVRLLEACVWMGMSGLSPSSSSFLPGLCRYMSRCVLPPSCAAWLQSQHNRAKLLWTRAPKTVSSNQPFLFWADNLRRFGTVPKTNTVPEANSVGAFGFALYGHSGMCFPTFQLIGCSDASNSLGDISM